MKPIIFHTNLKINFNNCAQTDSNSKKVREKNQLKQRQLFFIIFILKVLLEYRMPYDHMYPSLFSVIPLLLLITPFFFLTSSPPIPNAFFHFLLLLQKSGAGIQSCYMFTAEAAMCYLEHRLSQSSSPTSNFFLFSLCAFIVNDSVLHKQIFIQVYRAHILSIVSHSFSFSIILLIIPLCFPRQFASTFLLYMHI